MKTITLQHTVFPYCSYWSSLSTPAAFCVKTEFLDGKELAKLAIFLLVVIILVADM